MSVTHGRFGFGVGGLLAVSKFDSVVDAVSLYFGVTVSVTLGNCSCVATALVDIVLPDVPESNLDSEASAIAPVTFDSF